MKQYKNLSGNSGIITYETADEAILVEFQDGRQYLYTYQSTGRSKVEQMKTLAADGKGLCTFISRHVRDAYVTGLN